ncbi:hypothetical protein Holit_03000 [Hollandina sp. SP2]
MFQSTHPRGVRQYLLVSLLDIFLFQSTHPRGVRRGTLVLHLLLIPCFNPRTRVGCDAEPKMTYEEMLMVSIHAPAWGATYPFPVSSTAHKSVSIHAPAWGATKPHN